MKEIEKKEYEKPKITKIKLDAACAVLGFCKSSGIVGPGVGGGAGCQPGSPCDSPGS
ncbi:MAG: hypothetical protein PVI38_19795 [Desulfobacterales bacterium]|jgi:hypothetical protein